MLWFLSIAAKRGYRVDRYVDHAAGTMGPDKGGRIAMLQVVLAPEVVFSGGKIPTAEEHEQMHASAHHECVIANSVRSEVRCHPSIVQP